MRFFATIFILFITVSSSGQDSTTQKQKSKLKISGYADFYYGYDLNKPKDKLNPIFLYNFKKHDEVNVNLALLKLSYNHKNIRANLGIMTGNYAKYNLATEPGFFKHIYEASIGYTILKNFSFDFGIFPSHIGFESAITKDNWNLSQSIMAENSPYYETGIKINYHCNDMFTISFLLLNGWQNIKDHNSSKATGTQIQFTPNEKLLLNSSTFFGNEKPDSAKQLRLFHNFYTTYVITEKLKTAFLLDLGAERKVDKPGYNKWMGTAFLLRYGFTNKFAVAARSEYYKDKKGVIVSNYFPIQFKATGLSINADYQLSRNFGIRVEARSLHAKEKIFIRNNNPVQSNFSLLVSAACWF